MSLVLPPNHGLQEGRECSPVPNRLHDTTQTLSQRLRTTWAPGRVHCQDPRCLCGGALQVLRTVSLLQVPTRAEISSGSLPQTHAPEGSGSSLHRGNSSLKSGGFAPDAVSAHDLCPDGSNCRAQGPFRPHPWAAHPGRSAALFRLSRGDTGSNRALGDFSPRPIIILDHVPRCAGPDTPGLPDGLKGERVGGLTPNSTSSAEPFPHRPPAPLNPANGGPRDGGLGPEEPRTEYESPLIKSIS